MELSTRESVIIAFALSILALQVQAGSSVIDASVTEINDLSVKLIKGAK